MTFILLNLSEDGCHPNERGYQLLAQQVAQTIRTQLALH